MRTVSGMASAVNPSGAKRRDREADAVGEDAVADGGGFGDGAAPRSRTKLSAPGLMRRSVPTSSTMPVNTVSPPRRRLPLSRRSSQTVATRRREAPGAGDRVDGRGREQVGRAAPDDERRDEQQHAVDEPFGQQPAGERGAALAEDVEEAEPGERLERGAQAAIPHLDELGAARLQQAPRGVADASAATTMVRVVAGGGQQLGPGRQLAVVR